jgi:hypothetical protein
MDTGFRDSRHRIPAKEFTLHSGVKLASSESAHCVTWVREHRGLDLNLSLVTAFSSRLHVSQCGEPNQFHTISC